MGQSQAATSGRLQGNNSSQAGRPRGFLNSIWIPWRSGANTERLPLHKIPHRQVQMTTVSVPRSDGLYLLLCIPYQKYGVKCVHMDLCPLLSDQLFFKSLKHHHHEIRGKWKSLFSLKQLISIRFVQFEMYKSGLVDIRKIDDIPPESRRDEYRYNPIPAELIPPVGPNHMMHLFQHPEHAEDETVCLDKIPKKLRERLRLCPSRGTGLGWGIHFVEGLNWVKVWAFGSAGLLLSVLFGLVWSVLRDDVQGGFGVTACMMLVFTFTISLIQAASEPRY